MKRTGMCWVLILGSLMMMGAIHVEAAAKIEFMGGMTFDFGKVPPNTSLKHDFVFKNIGDDMLRIENLRGG